MWNSAINISWKNSLFRVISAIVIIGVFVITAQVARTIVQRLMHNPQNNFLLADALVRPCQPFDMRVSDHMYILRLDDVQAFIWSDVSTKILEDAFAKNFPVVTGIIPKNLSDDRALSFFLKKNGCRIEVAMHGWDHGESNSDDHLGIAEFEALTKEEAFERIEKGRVALSAITHQPIQTFIPPQNRISLSALEAFDETGMHIISSEGSGPYDYTTGTWDFEKHSFVSFIEIASACDRKFEVSNLCVIMIHPQDFLRADLKTMNHHRYQEYLKLIEYLSLIQANVVTFRFVAEQ